jgi:hypothetical protein
LVDSLTSLAGVRFNAGDFSSAISVARRMIDYGSRHGNERASAVGRVSAGMCNFATGHFGEARTPSRRGAGGAEPRQYRGGEL